MQRRRKTCTTRANRKTSFEPQMSVAESTQRTCNRFLFFVFQPARQPLCCERAEFTINRPVLIAPHELPNPPRSFLFVLSHDFSRYNSVVANGWLLFQCATSGASVATNRNDRRATKRRGIPPVLNDIAKNIFLVPVLRFSQVCVCCVSYCRTGLCSPMVYCCAQPPEASSQRLLLRSQ